MVKKKPVFYYVYRSSETGQFISKAAFEAADPTTVERVRRRRVGL